MEQFVQTIAALNDETRIKILAFIYINKQVCVCDIGSSFDMIQSRISRHLKILKDAGFLCVQKRGTWSYYCMKEPLDVFKMQTLDAIIALNIKLPNLTKECHNE